MPVYAYYCSSYGLEMELEHGMDSEEQDCPICKTLGSLEKIPSLFMSKVFTELPSKKPGTIVDRFIKDSKEELRDFKKDLKEEYKK